MAVPVTEPFRTHFYLRDDDRTPLGVVAVVGCAQGVSVGLAVHKPKDKFNRKEGRRIAYARACDPFYGLAVPRYLMYRFNFWNAEDLIDGLLFHDIYRFGSSDRLKDAVSLHSYIILANVIRQAWRAGCGFHK